MAIHSYHTKPNVVFYRNANEVQATNEIMMGLELEVEATGDRNMIEAQYCDRFGDAMSGNAFTYQNTDGSLSNGFEIISQPATLAYHMSESVNWQDRLAFLDQRGVKSHNTTTCGLHIHVNKASMTPGQQVKFGVFFNRFKSQIEKLGRRASNHYASFVTIPTYVEGTRPSVYRTAVVNTGRSRYGAVNYRNARTIELRFFKGTLKAATLKASLELAHAGIMYARHATIASICDANVEGAWTKFCNFVTSSNYGHLITYMRRRGVWSGTSNVETIAAPETRARIVVNGQSTKARVYAMWNNGITSIDELLASVGNSVQRTTISGWISSWRRNTNIPTR